MSFGSGAEARVDSDRLCDDNANGRRVESRDAFRNFMEGIRGACREAVLTDRVVQPACSSWRPDFRKELLSIVPDQCRRARERDARRIGC